MCATCLNRNNDWLHTGVAFLEEDYAPSFDQDLEFADKSAEDLEPDRALICANCRQVITSSRLKIDKDGSHQHTFFNPQGIVFTLGCFSGAPGCMIFGETSAEFSWFPGFGWNFALCSFCQEHLGWFFQSDRGESFFGLILTKLVSAQK